MQGAFVNLKAIHQGLGICTVLVRLPRPSPLVIHLTYKFYPYNTDTETPPLYVYQGHVLIQRLDPSNTNIKAVSVYVQGGRSRYQYNDIETPVYIHVNLSVCLVFFSGFLFLSLLCTIFHTYFKFILHLPISQSRQLCLP